MVDQSKVVVTEQGSTGEVPCNPASRRSDAPSRSISQPPVDSTGSRLQGKRVAMVTFYPYPAEPRTRRAVGALLQEGMSVDLLCIAESDLPARETLDGFNIFRFPLSHRRDSKLAYIYNYLAFIFISGSILALRSLKHRYDLVYVHNMPDILVLSALVPKLLGARVLLDIRDPMPELMTTIFNLDKESVGVCLMQRLEKWSMALAHTVVTVNTACERIFASRSCPPSKIGVVMNSPDEQIFPFRSPRSYPAVRGVPSRHFVIMYHGSLVERNGVDLAVEALARVRQAVPVAELRIYGFKTPFLEKVMDAARDKGLQESVHYLGARSLEELVEEIEDCDVGIISNQRNAFTEINTPTRIFEYLTMGKPVIAPRTPGIQDYFPPDSLVFFESGNAQELADKLRDVAFDYGEAVLCAERGQRVFLNHAWSRERLILVNLVDRLLRGTKGAAISGDQIQHGCGYK